MIAQFVSRCPACEAGILPGDEIERTDDTWIHAACVDGPARLDELADVCRRCYQAKARNGTCGCKGNA